MHQRMCGLLGPGSAQQRKSAAARPGHAIHALPLPQRSNPESFRGGSLDCFAALAMTRMREPRVNFTLVRRTQRSVSSTMRCRAGAHAAERIVACGIPALRSNACALQPVRDTRTALKLEERERERIATPDMRKRPWGAGAFCSRLGVGVVYISTWRLWGADKEPREFKNSCSP